MKTIRNITCIFLAFAVFADGQTPTLANSDDIAAAKNRANHTGTQSWATLTTTPTTLAGYGITDGATSAQGAKADTALQRIGGVKVSHPGTDPEYFFPAANTDAARGDAAEAAFADADTAANCTVDFGPGDYLMDKPFSGTLIGGYRSQFAIKDRMTIRLNGARLYKVATTVAQNALVVGTYYTIGAGGGSANWVSVGAVNNNGGTVFQATGTAVDSGTGNVMPTPTVMFCPEYLAGVMGASDWAIYGPGIIEGTAATTAGTAYTNEIAVNTSASRRWRVDGVSFIKHQGTGFQANNANFTNDATGYSTGWKASTGHLSNCNFDLNNIGFGAYAGNEYITLSNCTFNKNLVPCDVYAGNTKFIGCDASANGTTSTSPGIRLRRVAAANDQHGCWIGGHITHNTGFAISFEAGANDATGNVNNTGFIFSGVTFGADSTTTNKIQSLGGGLNLIGCYLQAPIFASTTPTGINMIQNCFIGGFPGTGEDLTSVADLSTAERLKWRFKNNHNIQGPWPQNDANIFVYADNTAALVDLKIGDEYRDSSGNVKVVIAP